MIRSIVPVVVALCAACQVDIPRDQIGCGPAGECPAGTVCSAGLCELPNDEDGGPELDGGLDMIAAPDGDAVDLDGWDAAVIPGTVVATLSGDEEDRVTALARYGELLFVAGESNSSMLHLADCEPTPSPLGAARTIFVAQLRLIGDAFACDWLDRFPLIGEVNDLTAVYRLHGGSFDDLRAVVGGRFEGIFFGATAVDSSDGFVLTIDSNTRPRAVDRITGFFHLAGVGQDEIFAVEAHGDTVCAAGAISPPPAAPRGVPIEAHDEDGGVVFCIQLFAEGEFPSARFSRGAFFPSDPVGGVVLEEGDYRMGWNARLADNAQQPALIEFDWDGTANAPMWSPDGGVSGVSAPGLTGDASVIALVDGFATLTVLRDREVELLRPTEHMPIWAYTLRTSERVTVEDVAGIGAEAHMVGIYEGSVSGSVGLPNVSDANGYHLHVDAGGALDFYRTGEGGRLAAVEPDETGVFLGGSYVGDGVRYPATLVAPNGDEGEGFVVFRPAY